MMTQHTVDPKAARQAWLALLPAQNARWTKSSPSRKILQHDLQAEAERGMDEASIVGHGAGLMNVIDGGIH